MLVSCERPLSAEYDVAMLDLDGVVYVGAAAVPGSVDTLAAVANTGLRAVFVTNNASRTPDEVAAHLTELGIPAGPDDVVTSAQAAAELASKSGYRRVFLLGGPGLSLALDELDIETVANLGEADAVVTGYGPDVVWKDLMRGAVAIAAGVPWIASNTDLTYPTDYGVAPGHGAQVRMISEFAGVEPVVAGKPAAPLLETTIRRTRASRPLMVGDRLDTDIAGAQRLDIDSLLVLTGVTGLPELLKARRGERPTFLARDLSGLLVPHGAPVRDGARWSLGGWSAYGAEGALHVEGQGEPDDWWRVVAAASWHWLDQHGHALDADGLAPPTGDPVAR